MPPESESLRVFISHTGELRQFPRRQSYVSEVERAITAAGHVVVDMADFPAADQPPASPCDEKVRGCRVYIGLLGTRYGSPVQDKPEMSYTELEFDTATAAALDREGGQVPVMDGDPVRIAVAGIVDFVHLKEGNRLGYLGLCHHSLGDYQQATDLQTQALEVARDIGHRYGEANALTCLGSSWLVSGNLHREARTLDQAIRVADGTGVVEPATIARSWRGRVAAADELLALADRNVDASLLNLIDRHRP